METNTSEQSLDNTLKEYFDNIKTAIDDKFDEFYKKLNEAKGQLVDIVTDNMKEYGNLNNEVQELQVKVSNTNKSDVNFKEEVKNLKKMIDVFIDQCEELEVAPDKIRNFSLKEVILIKDNDFSLKNFKLKCLKKLKKGKSGNELKWNSVQKKDCTLSEDNSVMKVIYYSCWNAFFADKVMNSGVSEVKFKLTILNNNTYCCIGVVNNIYNDVSSCFCQKATNAFMLYADGSISINGNSNSTNLSFMSSTEVEIYIKLDLDARTIQFTIDNTESESYGLNGDNFKFVVGMCTGGDVTYRILESDINGIVE